MDIMYNVLYFVAKVMFSAMFILVCQAKELLADYMDLKVYTVFGRDITVLHFYYFFLAGFGSLLFDLVVAALQEGFVMKKRVVHIEEIRAIRN